MNRKTLFCFLTALIMIFVLAGCSGKNSGGNIDNVQIPDWKYIQTVILRRLSKQ